MAPIHDRVAAALAPEPGDRIADLACGTGAVAIRLARAGADVVGLDISPGQLAKARTAAADEGLAIRFDEGDCQALPYEDASFHAVTSTFGLIFAPDHARAAGETARVCRSGGRLALTSWTHDGWSKLNERVGRPVAEGDEPTLWSREDYAQQLLGDAFELRFERGEWVVPGRSAEAVWDLLATSVPPLKTWLETLEPDERRRVDALYLEFLASGELRRDYVLVLGSRR